MMADRTDDTAGLEPWLAERVGVRDVCIDSVRRPQGSGFSADTFIFDASDANDGRPLGRFVLRKETPDPPIYPQQAPGLDVEIAIQYRVMEQLSQHSTVPLAPLIGYEPDRTIFGQPFFVMRFVDGVVPIENPIYTRSGFFVDATPAQRAALVDDGLHTLAQMHAVDWRTADLGWLVPPGVTPGTAVQVDLWQKCGEHELRGREHPLIEAGFAWLRANMPADREICFNWGDARLGNMIWRDFRCVCATDFEASSIAPPEVDLGWWLMFDRWSHEAMGAPRLEGEPTREEQRTRYAEITGRDVGDTTYYEIFAAARYSVIVVRVMNRSVDRGVMSPDNTIWLHNQAVDCLRDLLDLVR
jgi:aminoglycoside phosphotransferase (APT) family kinase protein